MDAFTLRPATREDGPAIALVYRRSVTARLPFLPTLHTPLEDRGFFSGPVFDASTVWVAEADMIVGFIAWRKGWVDHLYVAPEAIGRGIGSALLAKAMEGQALLDLWAFQKNTDARAFYAAKKFQVVRETDGSRNEEREPDVHLRWVRGA